MIREVRAVMKAMKLAPIDLPRYPVARFNRHQPRCPVRSRAPCMARPDRRRAAAANRPRSCSTCARGKPQTEVDVLNGAVAAAGRANGVPTPVNAVYARVLDDIAHMPQLWAKYRERPEALEAEVEAEVRRVKALPRQGA